MSRRPGLPAAAAFALFAALLATGSSAQANVLTCPTGSQMFGTPGTPASFCIETTWRAGGATDSFDSATYYCSQDGMTVCNLTEWQTACYFYNPNNLATPVEWVDSGTPVAPAVRFNGNLSGKFTVGGTEGCSGTGGKNRTLGAVYRCCLR